MAALPPSSIGGISNSSIASGTANAPGSGQIGTLVRNWLHYDNMASTFYKQANSARQLRDQYDTRIIQHLRTSGMENAVIQINGGHINVVEERNPRTLSLTRIEELLHSYFGKKGGMDETGKIMSYIREHRGVDVVKRLKKSGNSAPVPPPPGSGT